MISCKVLPRSALQRLDSNDWQFKDPLGVCLAEVVLLYSEASLETDAFEGMQKKDSMAHRIWMRYGFTL